MVPGGVFLFDFISYLFIITPDCRLCIHIYGYMLLCKFPCVDKSSEVYIQSFYSLIILH